MAPDLAPRATLQSGPRRIILHAGFHETGGNALRQFLWDSRAILAPHLSLVLNRHLESVVRRCKIYAQGHNPLVLAELVEAMDEALLLAAPEPGRDLVISADGLSGHCPGRRGVDDYAAAPVLAGFLTGYLAERFPGAEIALVYTTRAAEDWRRAAWQHPGDRQTEPWEVVRARIAGVDPEREVAEIAQALAPLAVYALPMEEAQTHPCGMGGALLELAGLPETVWARLLPAGDVGGAGALGGG